MSAAQSPAGYIATVETRHFSFEGHGTTKDSARASLAAALLIHGHQYGLPDHWAAGFEENIRPFMPGLGFRDGESLDS